MHGCHGCLSRSPYRRLSAQATGWTILDRTAATVPFESTPGVPTLAQYWADMSSSYIVGGCRNADSSLCSVAFHATMHVRACACDWGEAVPMVLRADYEWEALLEVGAEPTRETTSLPTF